MVRFACRKRVGAFFWSLFCASCMLKSKIFNTVHKRSQKRICLARRHFRTFRWTALIFHDFSWALAVRFWGPKKRPCLWGKETQRFFWFVLRVVHAKVMLMSKIVKIAHGREAAWHGGTFGPFAGRPCLPLGLLPCAFGGRQIVPASGERKRSVFLGFVLRVVHAKDKNSKNCSQKRICLARRHFRTLRWTALTALWALAVRF